jgi:hypothetical protein
LDERASMREEKKVSRTVHDRACARQQHVPKSIAQGPDAEFISCVVFSGENDDIEHFQALALRRIQPDKRRHECHPGLPSASDINRSS